MKSENKFDIAKVAREYAYSKFPLASKKENEKLIADWINKIEIARKIVEDFRLRVVDPKELKILDAGSGNGGTSIAFTEAGAVVSGVEVSEELVDIARRFADANNARPEFILYGGKKMPFGDNSFDAALSTSVLEHVDNPVNYLSEILRVLKPGGYLYLSFPNRLWPRETHTLLWFIHWLPYKMAASVVKILKHCPYEDNNLHFYSYWDLKKTLRESGLWEIKEEKGRSQNIVKNFIKLFLSFFGISYKYFLPHIQLILIKMPARNASHGDAGGENKKIKIAFMSDKMDVRPEKSTVFRELVEHLSNYSEFEIYLLHYKSMPDSPVYKMVNEIILPKISLPFGSHFFSFIWFCLTTKQNFDIFLLFVPRPYPFFWLMPAKKKVIMAHGGGSVTAPVIFTVPNLVFNFVMKFFNKYMDAVIGVSEYGSREIIYAYRVPPEKVYTIYNALDPVYHPFSKEEVLNTLDKYKITADKFFLYLGGLQIHKNIKRLIESYILLRQENLEIKEKLIIAGIYSDKRVKEICDETNLKKSKYYSDVIFSGQPELKDKSAFYSGATALVFPSLNEGFGLPVIEAMACGTPVITSNVTSMPEVAGGAAILINPYNIEDMANAMKIVATDKEKREELIKKGIERVKFFTWEKCIADYIALFKKVLYN